MQTHAHIQELKEPRLKTVRQANRKTIEAEFLKGHHQMRRGSCVAWGEGRKLTAVVHANTLQKNPRQLSSASGDEYKWPLLDVSFRKSEGNRTPPPVSSISIVTFSSTFHFLSFCSWVLLTAETVMLLLYRKNKNKKLLELNCETLSTHTLRVINSLAYFLFNFWWQKAGKRSRKRRNRPEIEISASSLNLLLPLPIQHLSFWNSLKLN